MKTLKTAALVLGISLFALPQLQAEGFVDVYGGFGRFSDLDVTRSWVGFDQNTTPPTEFAGSLDTIYPNSKALDSYSAGFRVGGLMKMAWGTTLAFAFDSQFYNVGVTPSGAEHTVPYPFFPAQREGTPDETYREYSQGGFVWQPGAQIIFGIPLRYIRGYVGYGLMFPVMFYKYSALDMTTGYITPNTLGVSGAVGNQFIFGGRWLITKRLNIFVEDRIQMLFTPMVIKNSYGTDINKTNPNFIDSSVTFKNLKANHLLLGMGFSFGG